MTALPDLVYVVRPVVAGETDADSHAELRYSLRSLGNAERIYGRVWIVGTVPSWVRNVETIPLEPQPEKFANIRASVSAACHDDRVAEQIVVMNDDFFVMDPIAAWDAYHLGATSSYVDARESQGVNRYRNTWLRGVVETADHLDHGDLPCYEAHTPLLFDRELLGAALDEYPADRWCAVPGFYPIAGLAGEGVRAGNSKVKALDSSEFDVKHAQPMPYLSTSDASFRDGVVGGFIRGAFRSPSPYEETS